jgi:DNA-binding CsgD family transcriptional regulator
MGFLYAKFFNKIPRILFLRTMSASTQRNKIGVLLLEKSMSLKELAEALEITEKKAYSLLKNMFQEDRVVGYKDEDGQRRYRNSEEETAAALKRKAKDDKKAAKSD